MSHQKEIKEKPFKIGKLNKGFSIPEQVLWDRNKKGEIKEKIEIVKLPKEVLEKAEIIGNVFDRLKELQKTQLTTQEQEGLYELLPDYLFNEKKPPLVGCLGISPYGYIGLVHLWERIRIGGGKKTDYKKLLKTLCPNKKK